MKHRFRRLGAFAMGLTLAAACALPLSSSTALAAADTGPGDTAVYDEITPDVDAKWILPEKLYRGDNLNILAGAVYDGLEVGREYILEGTLMNMDGDDGPEPVKDQSSGGSKIVAYQPFVSAGSGVSQDVMFEFDGSDLNPEDHFVTVWFRVLDGDTMQEVCKDVDLQTDESHLNSITEIVDPVFTTGSKRLSSGDTEVTLPLSYRDLYVSVHNQTGPDDKNGHHKGNGEYSLTLTLVDQDGNAIEGAEPASLTLLSMGDFEPPEDRTSDTDSKGSGSKTVTFDLSGAQDIDSKTVHAQVDWKRDGHGDHQIKYLAELPVTCETDGRKAVYYCGGCGGYFADSNGHDELALAELTIPATGHDYGEEQKVDTACGQLQQLVRTCRNCGDTQTSPAFTFTQHSLTHYDRVEPTAEEPGNIEYWECTRCGALFADSRGMQQISINDVLLLPTKGQYEQEVVEPTCTAPGYTINIPIGDPDSKVFLSDWTDPVGHEMSMVPYKEATETEDGHLAYGICEKCGGKYQSESAVNPLADDDIIIRAHAHRFTQTSTAATCTEPARMLRTCTVCLHETASETGPALGHQMEKIAETAASHEDFGWHDHYHCKRCDGRFSDAQGTSPLALEDVQIEKTGHSYEAYETPPTCDADGYTAHICWHCGDTYIDTVVPAIGHNLTAVDVVPPREDRAGNIAHFRCENCGKLYQDADAQTELSEDEVFTKDHSFDHILVPADCTRKGYTLFSCIHCGTAYIDNEVDALGHRYVDGVCSRCGAEDPGYDPMHPKPSASASASASGLPGTQPSLAPSQVPSTSPSASASAAASSRPSAGASASQSVKPSTRPSSAPSATAEPAESTPRIEAGDFVEETVFAVPGASSQTSATLLAHFYSLESGESYTIQAKLMNPKTGEAILAADGKAIEAVMTFSPNEEAQDAGTVRLTRDAGSKLVNGSVPVTFSFDARDLEAQPAGAMLTLLAGDGKVITRSAQPSEGTSNLSIVTLKLTGSASSAAGTKTLPCQSGALIKETITYEGVEPNVAYSAVVNVLDAGTMQVLTVNGQQITARAAISSSTGTGSVDVNIPIDTSGLAGRQLIVQAELYKGDVLTGKTSTDDSAQRLTVSAVTPTPSPVPSASQSAGTTGGGTTGGSTSGGTTGGSTSYGSTSGSGSGWASTGQTYPEADKGPIAKTGDDTNLALYIWICAGGAAAAAAVLILRRRELRTR
ncbi:MAG: VaFE repeat-containing surface-anchored protein [Clostridia bacterium]|nr:VaFE repeat-containing surface-anchored protein [Clostridia bacterium]